MSFWFLFAIVDGMTLVPLKGLSECAGNVMAAIWLLGPQPGATVLALQGDLGSGKTTFMQALAKRFGIKEAVQSPTYVLMKKYDLEGPLTSFGAPRRFKHIIHIDAYRLESPEQFLQLKPEEFLNNPLNLVVVEWPEKIEGYLPEPNITLKFSSSGMAEGERSIEMQK